MSMPGFRLARPGKIICYAHLAFCLICAENSALTQQPVPAPVDPGQQVPTLSIAAHEVLLDVVVTDVAGHPVTGLNASDFMVTEEGEKQLIKSLEEHHPMSAEGVARLKAASALAPNTFTNFTPQQNTNASTIILLDALGTPLDAQMELRQQLIEYLKHMQPGTPIAIFQLDTELRLIQGFSFDPQVLLAAAMSKRDMPSMRRPNGGFINEHIPSNRDLLRQALRMIGRYLAGVPGRKNLIWFTGESPQQTYITGVGNPFKDDFDVVGGFDGSDPDDVRDVLAVSRVAVYPVDARGLQVNPQSLGGIDLDFEYVAEATGGRAYFNNNGFKETIAQIVGNGSNYYTLAYATTNQNWDGQFRHIKVAVDRPGVRIQNRQGYYAVDHAKVEQRRLAAIAKRRDRAANNPFGEDDSASEESPPEPEPAATTETAGALIKHPKGGFEASMQLGAVSPTEIVITAKVAEDDKVEKLKRKAPLPQDNYLEADYRGKPFRIYTVMVKADARALRLARGADDMRHGRVEFVTLVYDQVGTRVNSLLTTAVLDVSEEHYRRLLASGLVAQQQIAVPVKGNYFLRVGVHDVASDHIGALEVPVDEVRAGGAVEGLAKP